MVLVSSLIFYSLWWILVVEVNSSDKGNITCAIECLYKDYFYCRNDWSPKFYDDKYPNKPQWNMDYFLDIQEFLEW